MTIHDRAEPAARAAECAAALNPAMFFDYVELVYANQDDLTDEMLQAHASTLGLDRTAFDACLAGQSTASRVQRDVDSGITLGIDTIPTFFVNDEMVGGYKTAGELGAIIDRHLAEP